jgi:hypothetical protein
MSDVTVIVVILLIILVLYLGVRVKVRGDNYQEGLQDALLGRDPRVWTAGAGYRAGYREGSKQLLEQRRSA